MNLRTRIQGMNKHEQMEYLLAALWKDAPRSTYDEAIQLISELSKGVAPDKFLETFELEGTYNLDDKNPSITVIADGQPVTIDINDPSRKAFIDPNPEKEKRPVKSFLTKDELDELNNG